MLRVLQHSVKATGKPGVDFCDIPSPSLSVEPDLNNDKLIHRVSDVCPIQAVLVARYWESRSLQLQHTKENDYGSVEGSEF